MYRTVSIPTAPPSSLVGAEDLDDWEILPISTSQLVQGSVKFATSCVTSLTIKGTFDRDPDDYDGASGFLNYGLEVWIDGVLEKLIAPTGSGSGLGGAAGGIQTEIVPCTPSACGNIWELRSNITLSASRSSTYMYAKITAINA
jgi:hypothetical protein